MRLRLISMADVRGWHVGLYLFLLPLRVVHKVYRARVARVIHGDLSVNNGRAGRGLVSGQKAGLFKVVSTGIVTWGRI